MKTAKNQKLITFVLAISVILAGFSITAMAQDGDLTEVTLALPRQVEVLDESDLNCGVAMGYYEEEGIKLKYQEAHGTSDVKYVSTGQAKIAYPSQYIQLTAHENDLPIKSFFQKDVEVVWAYAVRPDSDIDSIKDFEGKSIALGAPAFTSLSNPQLRHAGVDPDSVEYINAGKNKAQRVWQGKVDILFTWEKEYQLFQAQGMDFKIIPVREVTDYTGNSLVAHVDTIENNPELMKGLSRAVAKSLYFQRLNPEAATEIVLNKYPSIKVDFLDALRAVEANVWLTNDKITEAVGYGYHRWPAWETNIQDALDEGIIGEPVPQDKIWTNEFIPYANDFDREEVRQDAMNYELSEENKEACRSNKNEVAKRCTVGIREGEWWTFHNEMGEKDNN